jgi:hypothetical protein
VNDRGVVVGESGRNEEEITAFYPWNTVVSIKVGEPEPQRGEPLTGNIRIPGN